MAFNQTYNRATIEAVKGTMFSGKSKELIERGYRAENFGHTKVHYFKPAIDTRSIEIVSRDGQKQKAILLEKGKDLLNYLPGAEGQELIIIDEAQFFDESIIYAVQILKAKGYNVVIGGLDKDFRGEPFGFMPHIMALSDTMIQAKYSVCSVDGCVEDGAFPLRLRNGKPDSALSPTVVIEGSSDEIEYRPVCQKHHEIPDFIEYIQNKLNELDK
ncbi:MAG: thymidine kinase [Candidatus Heimdallarchaeota archaeon]|nr:thymidine kinase [Candidatus Heimdallarchaeota archaeon]